jgi:predicted esterase
VTIEQGIELPVTSRFKVSNNPDIAPGYCCVCHSTGGDGRQFIDFGMQLDVYGAVYFCTFCVTELASAAGFVAKEYFNKVQDECRKALIELDVTETSFKDYRDAARTILGNCSCRDRLDSGDVVDSKPSIPKPRRKPAEADGD